MGLKSNHIPTYGISAAAENLANISKENISIAPKHK